MGFEKEASSSSQSIRHLPREDTPLIHDTRSLSSRTKTFANVFMALIGSGVLGLPYTFMRTGWVYGSLMLFSVAALVYYCMMLLVHTRRKLEKSLGYAKISSFGELGYVVCGSIAQLSVDAMIVLSQAGFCVAYVIFIANTLAHLTDFSPAGLTPKSFYIWACFPFQLGLNSIPTLTHLAPLSIFADIVGIGSMGVIMVEDVIIYLKNRPDLHEFGGLSVFFYGLGVAVYTFEGIGMILPLESEAKDTGHFGKILGLSMGFISVMYGGFGVLGYFAFGEGTKDIITTNLGRGIASCLVQVGLCVNLFFTFPLMMNPVYEVLERQFCEGKYCLWLRWLMVFVVSSIALLVPNFADFLSLVGSSVCCVLGFVLPALFHYLAFREEIDWRGMTLDAGIMVFGIVVAVSGTWISITEIFALKY